MTARVITFPLTAPSFSQWLADRVGGRWVVTKRRAATWRGISMADRIQLLPRQYDAFAAQYEAIFGDRYAA